MATVAGAEVVTELVGAAVVTEALVVVAVVGELLVTNAAEDWTASFGVTGCELWDKFSRRSS